MPDRPLLIFPSPGQPLGPKKSGGGSGRLRFPSRSRQAVLLDSRFERIERWFEERKVRLQAESHDLVPEEVLVLETVGTVEDFAKAVEKVEGLEWLAEYEQPDVAPDEDFFEADSKERRRDDKQLSSRLFLVSSNQAGLREILSLWQRWKASDRLKNGLAKWDKVFSRLRDVRRWDARDRLLETGALEDWRERLAAGADTVPCEIELWFRRHERERLEAERRTEELIREAGGRTGQGVVIEEIGYHALPAKLPVGEVRAILDGGHEDISLVQCERIQFFRASGQMAAEMPDDADGTEEAAPAPAIPPRPDAAPGGPVVALLDGLPLQQHVLLAGRLIVDDPDDYEAGYAASDRRHGSAMASLILHGDLGSPDPPLQRPLYVRPILKPDPRDPEGREAVPDDVLVVDLVHRAVRRLFDGEGPEGPTAPSVCVINLSIGILDRMFDHVLSPLARVLDWLSWRYQVLFVVSAGNHAEGFRLLRSQGELSGQDAEGLERDTLRSIVAMTRLRRLLSPAESVNALTVGAIHTDAFVGHLPPRHRDPYVHSGLPSLINAQGPGFRRAVKPEVFAPGGRVVLAEAPATLGTRDLEVTPYVKTLGPGQKCAAPGATGSLNETRHDRGTSNAAALMSRAAVSVFDVLEDLRAQPDASVLDEVPKSILVKALLAHGASWGAPGAVLHSVLSGEGQRVRRKDRIATLLGYGRVELDRVEECTERRVTVVGCGLLGDRQRHIHRLPLPGALKTTDCARRLIVTLAWFSPVNPRDQRWRRAKLWFGLDRTVLGVQRKNVDQYAARRGTLQHEIFESDGSAGAPRSNEQEIEVNCRADAGILEDEVAYALVATLEVTEGVVATNLYDEIQDRLVAARQRVAVT